ncbi:TetR family transcriptional regulator [Streptomyces sulfonofaciens]|uniref:TetR family transcriptional regulator n=1 Tax=Streptomyces sulfonofaciens TaxID=68272 RepID=A0A919FW09_9ACTN|nr:TetR family transcriptional regulator [Streptomyces sulfonofaciens]
MSFRRARRPEHKELRASSIIEAARRLGLTKGVRAVTLTDIAGEAGLHKSAVLRYFETREEVFLRLTAEGWTQWARMLRDELDGASGATPQALAEAVAKTLVEQPLFCDLLAHASLSLEREVSSDTVLTFKTVVLAAVEDLAATAARYLPPLGMSGARELIGGVSMLAAALWQISHPPPTLATLYLERPELAHAAVDFAPKVTEYTAALATGLTERGAGKPAQ